MISINLEKDLLQVKTYFPSIDLSNIVQVLSFLEGVIAFDKLDNYIRHEEKVSGTDLVDRGLPDYISAIDYLLDSLVSTFSNINEIELKKQLSHDYFRLKQIREDIVQEAWELLGTNRAGLGSLRYTFMTSRSYFSLEKKMKEIL
jgi:hypothetical protein